MFTFRCAGCGKQHVVQAPFEKDYVTQCLRCGESMAVTSATIRHPHDEAITSDPPKATTQSTGAMSPDDLDVGAADTAPAVATSTEPRKRRVRGARRGPSTVEEPESDGADEGESAPSSPDDVEPTEEPTAEAPQSSPPDAKELRRRRLMIGGAIAGVLLLAGGAYFLFFRDSSKPPPKAPASRTTTKKQTTGKDTAPSTEKTLDKPTGPQPPVKPKGPEIVHIAAAPLAAELAMNAEQTNNKYKETLLEVSGLFDRIENRETIRPPARPHVMFACEKASVYCDLLASPQDLTTWRRLQIGQPFTVRGTYGKDGSLHGCELLPLTAPADARHKGKDVEVAGVVQAVHLPPGRPFPTLLLEGDTDSLVAVECRFELTAETEVRKFPPGSEVIIRGKCGGRLGKMRPYIIPLDNCHVVHTSSPAAPAERFPVIAFLREFEEDLRSFVLPAPGAEEQISEPLTLSRLSQEWAADPKKLDAKYRNKVVTVAGRLQRKDPDGSTLTLVSGKTDEPLKVRCLFDGSSFQDLSAGPEYRIRGRWSQVEDGSIVRLDSCTPADAATRDPRRVTVDYLPHRASQQLTYDIAQYPLSGRNAVQRVVFLQRADGLTETLITHEGPLLGKNLFDDADSEKWIAQKKVVTVRQPGLPGLTFLQRISGNFIEVGPAINSRDERKASSWEPVLKLAARTGDSWKWTEGNLTHEYTIEEFGERGGRSCVIVKEIVTSVVDPMHPTEARHVYVRDVGEVERRVSVRLTTKDRRLVRETKAVNMEASIKSVPR